jgi:hypothetical protein
MRIKDLSQFVQEETISTSFGGATTIDGMEDDEWALLD